MRWATALLAVYVFTLISTTSIAYGAADESRLYLTEVRSRKEVNDQTNTNLAPAIVAVKDAKGVLKGSDREGRVIIATLPAHLEDLRKSVAVKEVVKDVTADWTLTDVKPLKLKLSYKRDAKPTKEELESIGVKTVDDYEKGAFLVVEAVSGLIDGKLAERLEANRKITYATPLFDLKAIPVAGQH